MTGRIFLSAPDVRELERQYVLDAIDSNWVAPSGPALERFERQLADATGRAHAVALASGTAALHLALLEAGVRPGDEVLCSTLTFVGSAAPIVHCGARPVFIDSEPTTWNMDPTLLERALAERADRDALPSAVVVVDLYGICADFEAITDLCARYEVPLIEDAAEAIGARHDQGPAGSFGVSAILSFNGNKLITTSGGGALVTDDESLAERVRFLSTQAREPTLHYEHHEIGFNYRMSNVLAALGSAQLERIDARIARRRQIYERYRSELAGTDGLSLLEPPRWGKSNHWLTCIRLCSTCAVRPAELIAALEAANIESRPVWKPMHRQPVFSETDRYVNGTSEALFDEGVCLPSGSGMTDDELDRVVVVLRRELL